MNFDKIINDMHLLQAKIVDYEEKYKYIEDVVNSINKDILKIEKKKANSKHILSIKILLMKDIVSRFNINANKAKEN